MLRAKRKRAKMQERSLEKAVLGIVGFYVLSSVLGNSVVGEKLRGGIEIVTDSVSGFIAKRRSGDKPGLTDRQIAERLNGLYNLELAQVDNYESLSANVKDENLSTTLAHISSMEQQHLVSIAEMIEELGASAQPAANRPSIGDGRQQELAQVLQLSISIKERAMESYRNLILQIGNGYPGLRQLLQDNLSDEDLQVAWLSSKLNKIGEAKRETVEIAGRS